MNFSALPLSPESVWESQSQAWFYEDRENHHFVKWVIVLPEKHLKSSSFDASSFDTSGFDAYLFFMLHPAMHADLAGLYS